MSATLPTATRTMDLAASRRQLLKDSLGIMVSAGGFGLVYGLTARTAGFSPIEAGAMSLLVFAGASQFVAVGYVLGGLSWLYIVGFTAFLNARHFLYAAAAIRFVPRAGGPRLSLRLLRFRVYELVRRRQVDARRPLGGGRGRR